MKIIGTNLDDDLSGTPDIDSIIGRDGNDIIHAGAGDDGLKGDNGDDKLFGEDGNDTFVGGSGKDLFDGGSGIDTVNYGGELGVSVDLSNSFALGASSGFDTMVSIENVIGSLNDDVIKGNSGNNVLKGLAGNDVLQGSFGADQMTGGTGANTFKFTTASDSKPGADHDVITDFVVGTDKFDVHGIDAVAGAINGEQDFTFIGGSPFANPGELRVEITSDGNTLVQGSTDFDTAPEFEVLLTGSLNAISAKDFIL